jgi:hypothetical protein
MAVVVPQVVTRPLALALEIGMPTTSLAEQLSYSGIVLGAALGLGVAADILAGGSGHVARKVWIFPVALLLLRVSSDLIDFRLNWMLVAYDYFIPPPEHRFDEPSVLYQILTLPAVTALGYALGSLSHRSRRREATRKQEAQARNTDPR